MGEAGVLLSECCSSGAKAGVAKPSRSRNKSLRQLSKARPKFPFYWKHYGIYGRWAAGWAPVPWGARRVLAC